MKNESDIAISLLRERAEKGDCDAQAALGDIFYFGKGVPKDFYEAEKWYRKAADQGHLIAQFNMGTFYRDGIGVPKDFSEAAKWFRKAAEQGEPDAQYSLATRYLNGEGVPKDFSEAVKWFRRAAEQGNPDAQNSLGNRYFKGEGVSVDYKEAEKWYRKAAQQGSEQAKKSLSIVESLIESAESINGLEKENRVEQHELKTIQADERDITIMPLRRKVKNGDYDAQNSLGYCYLKGEGVPVDYKEAEKWFRKAAQQGSEQAKYSLSIVESLNENTDSTDRLSLLREKAEKGDCDAQAALGDIYQFGQGVPKDFYEAAKWYRKAAEQGNVISQFYMGIFYRNGIGVPKDLSEAVKWSRKAAEQGKPSAQFSLAIRYLEGIGVPKDSSEAVKWFRKAAEQGDPYAKNILSIVESLIENTDSTDGLEKENRVEQHELKTIQADSREKIIEFLNERIQDIIKNKRTLYQNPTPEEYGISQYLAIRDLAQK